MKCRVCHSPMLLDRCETDSKAMSCWHQCPNCKTVRMTSEPASIPRADDNAYASDVDYSGSYHETYVFT